MHKSLSNDFNVLIKVELINFENEYLFVYGEDVGIDCSIKLTGEISPIVIEVDRTDYFLLMKTIFNNFAHDDFCDSFFLYDYEKHSKIEELRPIK